MKWFYDLKVSTKLISGFIIVALIAGCIGLIGVINIKTIDGLDTQLYEKMTVPLGDLVQIVESYQRMRGNVRDMILSSTEAEFNDYTSRINARNDEYNKNFEAFKKTLVTEEGIAATKEAEQKKAKFDEVIGKVLVLAKENKDQEALTLLRGDGEKASKDMEAAVETLKALKVKLAKQTSDNNTKTANSATYSTILLLIAGMIVSVVLGIFISSSISKPIDKLVKGANSIADGDLDVSIDIKTRDEIGILADAFRRMSDNLNDVMTNIKAASDQVASGAKQVSDSSMALSQGATEQASSIEELTASLEEIAAQTKLNANSAGEANELAETAKVNAAQGNDQMKDMLKAMDEINNSSSNISRIIKVIDEIAFQTNILALNAAVEAARAGQYGKGFAVVAEEVRNLAARSANAAKETTDMIEGSIKKVEGGTKIANETAAALNRIVDGIGKVADLVSNIAIASNEQATAISQINQGIMQVSQVVQTNSATSEESAAASEELASQAEMLKDQVGRFRLKKVSMNFHSNNGSAQKRQYDELSDNNYNMRDRSTVKNETKAATKRKISLSDNEYGKY